MGTLNITYYADAARSVSGQVFQAGARPVAYEDVEYAAVASVSNAAPEDTTLVRVIVTEDARLAMGPTPDVEVDGGLLIGAGRAEYFALRAGQKISAKRI